MKRTTILLSALILSSSAAAADIRPVLPPVHHLDTEVVTNVAVSARTWAFPADWNIMRLVGRGENIRSGDQFHVTATSHGLMFRLQ